MWWISVYQVERSFDKPVALCSLELVDKTQQLETVDTIQVGGFSVNPCVFLSSSCLVRRSWHLINDIVMISLTKVVLPCWVNHQHQVQ